MTSVEPAHKAETITSAESDASGAAEDSTLWRKLSMRVVYIDLLRMVVSAIPGHLAVFIFGAPGDPVWVMLAVSLLGILGALLDMKRVLTTRYRFTAERGEMRTGWLVHRYRHVARDRIRSVDLSAKGRHRLFRLRVVHIGSGARGTSFHLDAVATEVAEELRRTLTAYAPQATVTDEVAVPESAQQVPEPADRMDEAAAADEVLARFRRGWILYNVVNIWAAVVVAGPLFGLYWTLKPFGVDLIEVARRTVDWQSLGLVGSVALCLAIATPLGIAGLAAAFVLENWGFVLSRTRTSAGTALLTNRGLINTSTIVRDDSRLRGLTFAEPLLWRWLRLIDTRVITTGLRDGASGAPAQILPRLPRAEAYAVARRVLPVEPTPIGHPLTAHPRSALTRRLFWAVAYPAAAAGLLVWLHATRAVPDWAWLVPLAGIPLFLVLAYLSYRALGHGMASQYIVLRSGAVRRKTTVLQQEAIIGWTFQQSIFQRRHNRIDVGVSTAAGDRYYQAPDAGIDQALSLMRSATPHLAKTLVRRD